MFRQKAEPATLEDISVAQDLLETLVAHKDGCVGMAANMIGINKRIIAFDNEGRYMVMFNPEVIKKSGPLPLSAGYTGGKAVEVDQGAVSDGGISDTVQDLHRLDSADHPARDRPLRGCADLIAKQCALE